MTTQETPPAKARAGKERSKERVKVPPPPGSIADLYAEVLPTVDFEAEQTKWDVALTAPTAQLRNVLATSRRHPKLQMDLLRNQTAVDWVERGLEVVYHLYSTTLHHSVAIKSWVPAENPALPTVTDLWRMADWAERECREMFGIEFLGHPDPRNLLLDEDLDMHPLLKSHALAPIAIEQGVDVEYFTKSRPREAPPTAKVAEAPPATDERAQRIAEAKKRAEAAAGAEAKPAAELTPEERAAKQAAQAERVTKARELAAARRSEGPPAARAPRPQAEATTTVAPEAAPAAAPAPAQPAAPKPTAPKPTAPKPTAPKPAAAKAPAGDLSPEEAAAKKAAQEERVRKARELAAQRRAQKEGS